MAKFLENFTQLIGTITTPFSREDSGKFTKHVCRIEVSYGDRGKLDTKLIFFEKKEKNIVDFSKDFTGQKVVVQGYLSGTSGISKKGNAYEILEFVGTDILIFSRENSKEKISVSSNMVVTDDDLPF